MNVSLIFKRENLIFSSFERMVAWRYLRARRKEGVASLVTGISFAGIMLGVAALIVVMSVMNGFREELLSRILGLNGHVIVQPIYSPLNDYKMLVQKINKVPGVRFSLPLIEGQVLVQGEKIRFSTGALVRGIHEQDLKKIRLIDKNIKQGNIKAFDDQEKVIIGKGMADSLGLSVGDMITLISPEGDSTLMGVTPRVKSYPVAAIFKVGMFSEYDNSLIYMPFKEAQLYFNTEKTASFIEAYLDDPDDPTNPKKNIEKIVGEGFFVSDWRQRNESFFMTVQIERNVMFVILSLIILVAALNIISGLVMLVNEKNYDIAILRTMGASRGAILRIFFMTGSIIGIAGTCAGFFLGYIVTVNIESIRQFSSWLSGTIVFNPEYYLLTKLPAKMDPKEVFSVIITALLLTFFSSLIPAWRASRLDPIEALRYE